jgi:hypothetical protein
MSIKNPKWKSEYQKENEQAYTEIYDYYSKRHIKNNIAFYSMQ